MIPYVGYPTAVPYKEAKVRPAKKGQKVLMVVGLHVAKTKNPKVLKRPNSQGRKQHTRCREKKLEIPSLALPSQVRKDWRMLHRTVREKTWLQKVAT